MNNLKSLIWFLWLSGFKSPALVDKLGSLLVTEMRISWVPCPYRDRFLLCKWIWFFYKQENVANSDGNLTQCPTFIAFTGRGITLKDPDNVIITSGKLSLSQISVFEISNPRRGAWTLTVSGSNGGHEFFVKSSSATNVDFEYYFLIKLPGRRRQPVEVPNSNPVIGKSNLYGLQHN